MDEMARGLFFLLGVLDAIIFEKINWENVLSNPSSVKELKFENKIGLLKPKDQHVSARFSPVEKNKKKDVYLINPRLQEYLDKFWFAFKKQKDKSLYTKDEVLISIAAHEVRHRVQFRLPINLCQRRIKTGNQLLDSIIKSAEEDFSWGLRVVENIEDEEKEFDALVIEKTTGESIKMVEGNMNKIAEIIEIATITDLKKKLKH
jgi:hypothetical protein